MGGPIDPDYHDHVRPEMRAFLPARLRRVLEVGCSRGRFGASLTEAEEVWGIEPDAAAAHIAATRLHKVFKGTFDAARPELPRGYFDLVVCNDVIEHMPDHDSFLRDIKDHIAPGGALVGSIPNVRHYRNLINVALLRDWEYEAFGILDRTHLRFFTEKSLRRTLEQAGFHIERFGGINSGIAFRWSAGPLFFWLAAHGLIVLSLGAQSDIRHLQFGFRAVSA